MPVLAHSSQVSVAPALHRHNPTRAREEMHKTLGTSVSTGSLSCATTIRSHHLRLPGFPRQLEIASTSYNTLPLANRICAAIADRARVTHLIRVILRQRLTHIATIPSALHCVAYALEGAARHQYSVCRTRSDFQGLSTIP